MSQEFSIFPDECLMNASASKVKNEYFSRLFNRWNYPGHYLFQPCTWLWSKTKRLDRSVRGTCTVCSVYFQMYLSSDSDLTKWKEKIGDGKKCWPETECIFNVAHGRVLGILHCRFECFMTSYTVESIIVGFAHPAIWERCTEVDARLGQRLRRWTSLAPTSVEGLASLSKPGDPLAGTSGLVSLA